MRIFITAPFGDNKENIEKLRSIIKSTGFEDYCFAMDEGRIEDPKELMIRAEEEIKKSDVLLIDITYKPTGRLIEAGMAYALKKKIIVIMKKGTLAKETVIGIADIIIEYEKTDDIKMGLEDFYNKI